MVGLEGGKKGEGLEMGWEEEAEVKEKGEERVSVKERDEREED